LPSVGNPLGASPVALVPSLEGSSEEVAWNRLLASLVRWIAIGIASMMAVGRRRKRSWLVELW